MGGRAGRGMLAHGIVAQLLQLVWLIGYKQLFAYYRVATAGLVFMQVLIIARVDDD